MNGRLIVWMLCCLMVSGVYVCFYLDDWTRVVTLTVLNIALLVLNNYMKPCSVHSINVMRDTFFIGAVLSGHALMFHI